MNKIFFLIVLSGAVQYAHADPVTDLLLQQTNKSDQVKPILSRLEKKIQALQKEQATVKAEFKNTRPLLDRLFTEMELLKDNIRKQYGSRTNILKQRLTFKSQQYQFLADLEQVQQHIMSSFDAQLKMLQEYASDEDFTRLKVPFKAYYDFDDVVAIAQQMEDERSRLAEAEKNKIAILDDITKQKKSLALWQDEVKERKKQQEGFVARVKGARSQSSALPAEQGELLDLEVHLAESKRELGELKVIDAERRLQALEDSIAMSKARAAVLKKEYRRVQRAARVSPAYVKQVEEQLETKRQQFVAKSDQSNDKLRVIVSLEHEVKQQLQQAQLKHSLSVNDLAELRVLAKEPKSVENWKMYSELLGLLAEEGLLAAEHEYLLAQVDLEKAQFSRDEIDVAIVKTWYKMTSEHIGFNADEELEQEIKTYLLNKAELDAQIVALTNARDASIGSLRQLNNVLDKIKPLLKHLQSQRTTLFSSQGSTYEMVARAMYDVEEKLRRKLNWIARLIETYSTTILAVQANAKKIENIIEELKSKSFWKRSDLSIRWNKVRAFIPDMFKFVRDLRRELFHYFSADRLTAVKGVLSDYKEEPLKFLLLFVNAIIALLVFYLLRLYIPDLRGTLQNAGQGYPWVRYLAQWFVLLFGFIQQYLVGIYLWSLVFVLFATHTISDTLTAQLFYLGSIPYLLFLLRRFFDFFAVVNRQQHFFMTERYQEKFLFWVPPVLMASASLICFRQAFLLGGYQGSPVPTMLLALMFTLVQIALIGLLDREQILAMLRSETPLGEWIYEHVQRYYYILWCGVIAIIVMSNPYVGYGRQVLYIVSRILLTCALIPVFSLLHSRLKRASLDLFFYYNENDEMKERFASGRVTYGLFVVSSLVLLLIGGVYLGGRIWGTVLSLKDMASWLNYSFYSLLDESGHEVSVTIASLLQIVVYVVGGMAVAAFLNRFVIRRALDPFLVEAGVQNTILTLVRYMIVIVAVFMGLASAGLEGFTTKLAILIAGIGFAVQEAIRDFVAYFIILVQRPIKIGDLIELPDTTGTTIIGFIRHITPRSIMIRQRNSVTVIVPNSRIIMQPVINWSYSRSFVAFDDIFITVPLSVDPAAVRKLILKVMDDNNNLLKTPAPVVRLHEFLDHGYRFLVRGYLTSDKLADQWDIASDFRIELIRQLRAQGIEIATPVRTVRMLGDHFPEEPQR